MRKTCSLGILLVWVCAAQDGPRTGQEIDSIQAALLRDLRGATETTPSAAVNPVGDRAPAGAVTAAILQHKPNKNAQKHVARGIALSGAGDRARAATEFEKAIVDDPEFAEAYLRLGIEYTDVGRYDQAEAMVRRSLVLDPASWSAYYDLGVTLYKAGKLDEAEQCARKALELSKGDANVHYLLGELLLRHSETIAEGLQHLRAAAPSIREANQALMQLQQVDK